MNHTEINSKFLGMSEDNDLEYYIRLPEWAEFFNGQEAFKLVIVNDDMFVNHNKYLASYHDKYKSIYNHLEYHQNDILKVLETYCLNEYNYYRKYRLTSCLKSYLEEQMKLTPVIENRADAARFFQLLNIQILPFKKEEEHYILFNIELIQAKKHDNSNESFSIMILGNDFYVVSPMNFDCYIAPVARNLTEFISLGIACKNFGILETVSVYSKEDFEYCLSKKESNPSIEEIIRIIKLNFPVISIKNPYDYSKKIQNEPEFKEESNYLNSYILKKLGLNE